MPFWKLVHVAACMNDGSDYRYRVVSDKAAFAECAAQLVRDIDYDNFKNAVAMKEGYRRAAIYSNVWADLLKLQAL